MAGPALPQQQLDVTMLPTFQQSIAQTGNVQGAADTPAASAALTGDARAAFIQQMRAQQAAGGAGVPQYTPNAPSNLDTANFSGAAPVDPTRSGFVQSQQRSANSDALDYAISGAQDKVGANNGPLSDMGNWLFGAGGTSQEYAAKKAANATLGTNAMHEYLSQYPSLVHEMQDNPLAFAQRVGPMLEAAQAQATPGTHTGTGPDGLPYAKMDTNPALTDAFTSAHGLTRDQGHAGLEPGQYSLPEFLHATQGLSRVALRNMWEMQHYLDPKSQAVATGLARGQQKMLDEQTANAQTGATKTPAADAYDALIRQIITGMPSAPTN